MTTFTVGGTTLKSMLAAAMGRAVMCSDQDNCNSVPAEEVNFEVDLGTPKQHNPSRDFLLLQEKQRRLEAELLKVRGQLALEQQWMRSVATHAQGELEQGALQAFDEGNLEDEDECDDMEQELSEDGSYGCESDESEDESEDKSEDEVEEEGLMEGTNLKKKGADQDRGVENLWQELGLADSDDARKQGMRFLCKDGVCVPACPALLAAASPDLVIKIALHMEKANFKHQEATAHEIPLPDVSSAGLLYIFHCLQNRNLTYLGDIHCELSLELCFDLLFATSLFQGKDHLDRLVLASTFNKDADESTLVGYMRSARRLNPAKPEIRDRVLEYLHERLELLISTFPGTWGDYFEFQGSSLLKQLCWDDFEKLRLLGKEKRVADYGRAAWTMSAWSMVLKKSQYACSLRYYSHMRDILIWTAWQVSEEAAQAMQIHLPDRTYYCTAYYCYDGADCRDIEATESGEGTASSSRTRKSTREERIKSFGEPLPSSLFELSESGTLKGVLEKCGWNWPLGTLETIHPEVLLFKVKPLQIIDEGRLKRALRWQALHETNCKALSIKAKGSRPKSRFSPYLYDVLQQVHPGKTISLDAMAQLSCFIQAVLEKLALEAARIAKGNKQSTISCKNIERAVKLLFPGKLAKTAVGQATNHVTRYYDEQGCN